MFRNFWPALIASCLPILVIQIAEAKAVQNLHCDVGKELNLPVTEWLDDQVPVKGTFVAVHGLTLYAGAFEDVAQHLAASGYHVYALDMRGFGRWMREGASYQGGDTRIHIGQSQKDLGTLVERIRKDHPNRKIYFLGESQGSNLALWHIENHPSETNGAILFSPCYRMRSHPSPHWIADFFKEISRPDRPLNLEPYTRPYLTNDPVLTEKCDNDPLVNRTMTPAELVKCAIENRRAIHEATRVPETYPILMVAGQKDSVFKSYKLKREVKNFGDSQHLKLVLLPGKGHLLIEHQAVDPEIAKLIDTWLQEEESHAQVERSQLTPTLAILPIISK